MKKGKLLVMVLLLVLVCQTAGCGSADTYKSEDAYRSENAVNDDWEMAAGYGLQEEGAETAYEENGYGTPAAEGDADDTAGSNGGQVDFSGDANRKDSQQKIIKTYDLSYETETFDEAYGYLKEQIQKHQGYISSSELSGTEERVLRLTARIPAEAGDVFMNQLGSLGTIIRQSESAEDVTLQYADTESRITALKTEQKRLNELLEKADSLENIIALEDRLTEVRYELENYQSQKKLYDDRISYSTVDILLREVSYTVPVDDSTVLSRISTGLKSSFRDIREKTVDFLVGFIVALPYLIIWGIILFAAIWIIRRLIRRRKEKKQARSRTKEVSEEEQKENA